MASIELKKGTSISLKKNTPTLRKVRVCLGWDTSKAVGDVDLDVSAFGLELSSCKPLLLNDDYFVFYNHLTTNNGSIVHAGDNRVGGSEGDDEIIFVTLDDVDPKIGEIAFIVTIYNDAVVHTFKDVKNSYIRIVDEATDHEIAKYSLGDNFGGNLAVQFGSLVRNKTDWEFVAVGAGYNVGLEQILNQYGINL